MPVSIGGSGFITGLDQGIDGVGIITTSQLNVGTGGTVITTTAGGDINIDSGGVYYDASNNRFGIGTASPKSILTTAGNIVGLSETTHSLQHYQQASSSYTVTAIDSEISGASGSLVFKTNSNWTNGNATERMRITSDGTIKAHGQMQFTDGLAGNDKGAIQAFGDDFSNGNLRFYTKGSGTLTERVRIDSSGRVTMPYQPIASLSDTNTNDISNAILNSSNFYNTTWVNQGNHFDASTGRFNCPVAGIYRIYFRCSQNGNASKTNVRLRKNGLTINEAYSNITNDSVSSEAIVSCSNTDYLEIQVAELHAVGGSQHKQVTFQLLH